MGKEPKEIAARIRSMIKMKRPKRYVVGLRYVFFSSTENKLTAQILHRNVRNRELTSLFARSHNQKEFLSGNNSLVRQCHDIQFKYIKSITFNSIIHCFNFSYDNSTEFNCSKFNIVFFEE